MYGFSHLVQFLQDSSMSSHISVLHFYACCGDWTQGLAFVWQVLFHLSHAPSSFCFNYFSDRVPHFFPGLALDWDPPTSASHLVGITDAKYHSWLVLWDKVLLSFCQAGLDLGFPQEYFIPFYGWIIFQFMGIPHLFMHSLVCGHWGYFHLQLFE
jgi:hypothetical protein